MNFIWDMALRAKAQGVERESLFFVPAKDYSPYMEYALPDINEGSLHSNKMEINPLYRFSAIFQELLHPDFLKQSANQGTEEFVAYLFDAVAQVLCEIDLQHGLNRREYFVRRLREEVLDGVLGEKAQSAMQTMELYTQFAMADAILTQAQTGSDLRLFRRALLIIFPDAFLYQSRFDCKSLLLYIGMKENAEYDTWLMFIRDAFLPLGFSIQVFWEYHFGIMGVDAAMTADCIAIF